MYLTNQQKVIKLRNIIEEMIPNLAVDPLLASAIQIDYFEFYHAKLSEIENIDVKGSIGLMDKGSYNKILLNSLIEYINHFENLFCSKKDEIQLVVNNIDRIREEYLIEKYPEISPAVDAEVKYLNKLNSEYRRDNQNLSIFKDPYSRIIDLIGFLKEEIKNFKISEDKNEYVPKHISDKILHVLIENKAFKLYECDFDEFYNLLNIKPNFISFTFKSNTPKQILIRTILDRLDDNNRKEWFDQIVKRLDINKNSFESNQGRKTKIWKKLAVDLANLS